MAKKVEPKITISRRQFKQFLETALLELEREFPGADNESTIYRMLVGIHNATSSKNSPFLPFSRTTWNLYKRETA
jgi:hypothetical protein